MLAQFLPINANAFADLRETRDHSGFTVCIDKECSILLVVGGVVPVLVQCFGPFLATRVA